MSEEKDVGMPGSFKESAWTQTSIRDGCLQSLQGLWRDSQPRAITQDHLDRLLWRNKLCQRVYPIIQQPAPMVLRIMQVLFQLSFFFDGNIHYFEFRSSSPGITLIFLGLRSGLRSKDSRKKCRGTVKMSSTSWATKKKQKRSEPQIKKKLWESMNLNLIFSSEATSSIRTESNDIKQISFWSLTYYFLAPCSKIITLRKVHILWLASD